MNVVRTIDEAGKNRNTVLTVGTFDGVHLAHQEIVREVVHRARMREGRSVIITFEPHPKEVVTSARGPVELLTTIEERIELLEKLGVDLLLVIQFTQQFSQLSSREFYRKYVVDGIGVSDVVVGYDHMFGQHREAGTAALMQMGREFDFSVVVVHPYAVGGETVSSTKVRRELQGGEVEKAQRFLGYPYSFRGRVVVGDKRGRTIGYPTANIEPASAKKVVPARGVYLVGVTIPSGQYFGMMNIGVRPTVTDGLRRTIEVHIFDFGGDIYGDEVTVTFLRRLRQEQKFDSLEALARQLDMDREHSLRFIAEYNKRQ